MTFQIRETFTYRGQKRRICGRPMESYFEERGSISPFVWREPACSRGYQGDWEMRDDALHLVAIEGFDETGMPIGLAQLFQGHVGSVEATWFSGEIIPVDADYPESSIVTCIPPQHLRCLLLFHRGQLLLEECIDVRSGAVESRMTREVARLFSDHELAFLQAVRSDLDDPSPKLIYADWLEERGDERGDLLRSEAERARDQVYWRRSIRFATSRAEFHNDDDSRHGHVDARNMVWFWRLLAGIPR